MTWDKVKLRRINKYILIEDEFNGKTIENFGLKDGEKLSVTKRYTRSKPIPKATIIDEVGNVIPKLIKIFNSWYTRFSIEEKMNK